MFYFNVRRTMIVTIFYLFVSFNILTDDSRGIKNKKGGRYFRHRHFRLHYETKFLKRRLRCSSGHGPFNQSVITHAEAHMIYGLRHSENKHVK